MSAVRSDAKYSLVPDARGDAERGVRYRARGRARVVALFALVSTVLGVACRPNTGGGAANAAAASEPAVTLTRDACFGTCSVYTVDLFTDGRVAFEGRAHVTAMGPQTAIVAADSVQTLVRTLRASAHLASDGAWVEGAPECGRHVPDGPRFTLVVHAGGPTRTVQFDAGCTDAPRELAALADAVDRIAATAQWISDSTEN